MKKYAYLILLLLVAAFLVAACSGSATPEAPTEAPAVEATAEPAPEPTAEPTAESTEAASETDASEAVVEAGLAELTALVEHPWQWVAMLDQAAGPSDIADPHNYTIAFQNDGTVNIKADCNMVNGAYTVEGDSLTIELGPSTMAACPPESLSDKYLAYLGGAAVYRLADGQLHIDPMADGGTMSFDPADELGVPPPVEEITALRANPWQWSSFTNPVEQFDIDDPENYILTLVEDGTVEIKADCNNASGSYSIEGSSLTIVIGPMTMAACPERSRSDQFVQLLGGAAIYFFEDGNLYIDLMADGGTMHFQPAVDAGGEQAADGALPDEISARLSQILAEAVIHEGGDEGLRVFSPPGAVLLVDTPDGRFLEAAGVSNLEEGTLMQTDDRFEIGSITKSFVDVVLLQLVEEGVLTLDDPLSQWLPEMAAIVPNGQEMDLRQIAGHRAGLADYEEPLITTPLLAGDTSVLDKHYEPREIVQWVAENQEAIFAPGEEGRFKYSNTGYILLGMVLEAATGQPVGDLIQNRILNPLELESAAYLDGVPEPGQIVKGYTPDSQKEGEFLDVTGWDASSGGAAGALIMNAEDLAKYGKALAAGELFQNPGTLEEMTNFQSTPDEDYDGYGLGLLKYDSSGLWGHLGGTPGFLSYLLMDPERGISMVILMNNNFVLVLDHELVLSALEGGE